jgi:hypothetical protein
VYFEKDTYKQTKIRKTIRSTYLLIDTDNLGQVEFKATNDKMDWKNADEFFYQHYLNTPSLLRSK